MEVEIVIYVHGEPCIDGVDTWQRFERNTDEYVKNTWRKSMTCFLCVSRWLFESEVMCPLERARGDS